MPSRATIATQADIAQLERDPIETHLIAPVSSSATLEREASARPSARAITFVPTGDPRDGERVWTYGDLIDQVRRVASALAASGVERGDVVSYLLPNLPETHFILWGAEAAGIVNPINPVLDVEHIASILNAAKTRVLFASDRPGDSAIWERVSKLRTLVPNLELIVRVGGSGAAPSWAIDFDHFLERGKAVPLTGAASPLETASYFHTGGTTGAPKIARRTHRSEVANAWAIATVLGVDAGDTILCGLPLFHSNAMMITGLMPFSAGAHVVILGPGGYRTPETIRAFWRSIDRYRATLFSAVPTVLSALLATPREGEDLRSLRFAICGAAPLSVELFNRFEAATGVRVLEGYGMTEATCVSSLNPRDGERRIGSIGLRLPYQEMRVAEVRGGRVADDMPAGQIGSVVLRGPFVFDGYVEPAANAGVVLADGWIDTGDLGRQDADGYFWLTGRSKDLIIRGGHNIDPATIEEGMMRHPAVDLAAAVGKPDAYAGEVPVVFVTLRPGSSATPESLLEHARGTISERAAVPAEVLTIDAMPLTAVNKIFKPELRERAIARALAQAASAACGEAAVLVTVDPHPEYGLIATVAVTLPPSPHRPEDIHRIERALAPFAIRSHVRVRDHQPD